MEGDSQETDSSGNDSEWEDEDEGFLSNLSHGLPKLKGKNSNVIIDRSGVHRLLVVPCCCEGASHAELQYLEMGLFPCSSDRIKTAFTFRLLDDFRMDNVECKTSAYSYYQKLVQLTSNEFPQSVPVSKG
jgi:hypothetical protein